MDEPVKTYLDVRYGETDAMGVVYYANYFTYFEVGRTHFFRHWGTDYAHLEKMGIFAPVIAASCRYLAPARYGDELCLRTCLSQLGPVRLVFAYDLACVRREMTIARGSTTHAFVNESGRPLALKKHHPDLWQRLSAAVSP